MFLNYQMVVVAGYICMGVKKKLEMEVLIKEKGSGVDGHLVQVQWIKIR